MKNRKQETGNGKLVNYPGFHFRFPVSCFSFSSSVTARFGLLLGCLFCFVLTMSVAARATPVSFQDIEESLTCQCGCGLTVHSCNHLQCDSAMPLRAEIRAQIDAGKDKDTILAYFSGKYGEKILSSQTASGFNVLAWVPPFGLFL